MEASGAAPSEDPRVHRRESRKSAAVTGDNFEEEENHQHDDASHNASCLTYLGKSTKSVITAVTSPCVPSCLRPCVRFVVCSRVSCPGLRF